MKKISLFVILAAACLVSCSKKPAANTDEQAQDTVAVSEEAPALDEAVNEELFEEEIHENDPRYYDHIMDMYVHAVKFNEDEIMMATAENIAEAQMEGLLSEEQEKRWRNIDEEIKK